MEHPFKPNPFHILYNIPFIDTFASLLGKLLNNLSVEFYCGSASDIVEFPEAPYTRFSLDPHVWFDRVGNMVVSAPGPAVSGCRDSDNYWRAISKTMPTRFARGTIVGFFPTIMLQAPNGKRFTKGMLDLSKGGAFSINLVDRTTSFKLHIKFRESLSSPVEAEFPPTRVVYAVSYSYPTDRPGESHCLPIFRPQIRSFVVNENFGFHPRHLKTNPQILGVALKAFSDCLAQTREPRFHLVAEDKPHLLTAGDLHVKDLQEAVIGNEVYYRTILEVPAFEYRGVYCPFNQEWLAQSPEQQRSLPSGLIYSTLPGPQWMRFLKAVDGTRHTPHEVSSMKEFKKAGFHFSTTLSAMDNTQYTLDFICDQASSDPLASSNYKEPPRRVVYQLTCSYTSVGVTGPGRPTVDYYELHLVLPSQTSHSSISSAHSLAVQARHPSESHPQVLQK